jgi:hypothetical protein
MDQTTMFTSEEQSGSGQTNMLSLIQQNQNRIKELRRTPHTFWSDPGHGWLEVSYQDLIVLDIFGKISGYSYRKGDKVYLEEDMDAGTYITALWGNLINGYEYELWKSMLDEKFKESIFIRNLQSY